MTRSSSIEPSPRTAPGRSRPGARALSTWATRTPARVFALGFLLVFTMSGFWSLLTPLGGSPDEIAHIAKAAGVAHGQVFGEDVDGTQLRTFEIPAGIRASTDGVVCTILQPNVPAGCVPVTPGAPDQVIDVITSAGLYNPVYYWLVGWPSLFDHSGAAVHAMRLVSAAISSIFFGLMFMCLSLLRDGRVAMQAGVLLLTPTVLFLGGMVNPNVLEVSTVAAFTAALFTALRLRARGRVLWWLAGIMIVSGALSVHARSLAPLWILIAVVVAVVVFGPRAFWRFLRRPPTLVAVAAVVVSGAVAGAVLLGTGSLGENGDYEGKGTPWDIGLKRMVLRTWGTFPPMVGSLGWNERLAPEYAVQTYIALGLLLVVGAVIAARRFREGLGVVLALGAFVMAPAVIQAASVTESGYIWQGRYGLALLSVLLLTAGVVATQAFERLSPGKSARVLAVVIGLLALAQAGAMQVLLHRYASGVESRYSTLVLAPSWTPFGLPILVPITVIWLVAAVFGVLAWLLVNAPRQESMRRRSSAISSSS